MPVEGAGMMKHAHFFAFLAAFAASSCSHGNVVPVEQRTTQSVTTRGNFTEYSLPSGVHPTDLTRGPYDTLWFTSPGNSGAAATIYQMVASTGKVHAFTAPAFGGNPTQSAGFDAVIGLNRSVYYVVKQPVSEDLFFFARVTPEGVFSFTNAPYFEFGLLTNFAQIPGTANVTYGYCVDPCLGPTNGQAAGASLDSFYVPTAITGGPGGDLYVTARCNGLCSNPTDAVVYVISPGRVVLHKYPLPKGSAPMGIVTGSDNNLWITESGTNKIARMTPAGALTQFSIPTANSGADRITYGYDKAQWFTERNVNKIARVTTAGAITEYAIPTASSNPTGITPCEDAFCGTHGGLWFTETNANKIGRFNAPI
jgi:streptogramin lyase